MSPFPNNYPERGRGRPKLPRDAEGNIIRPDKPNKKVQIAEAVRDELAKAEAINKPSPRPPAPIVGNPNVYHAEYSSVTEYLADALTLKPQARNAEQFAYWQSKCEASWYGLPVAMNPNQVKDLINSGWQQGSKMVNDRKGRIEIPALESIKRKQVWSDQGDDFDLNKIWRGDLETAFRGARRVKGRGPKSFRIVVESIAPGSVDSRAMVWRGIGAIVLADALTEAGHNVEIVSAFKATASGVDISCSVVTKDMRSPVDIASLAGSTALPAFFRAIGHSWIFSGLQVKHYSNGVSVGRLTESEIERDDVYMSFLADQYISSARSAQDWINEQVERLEVNQE